MKREIKQTPLWIGLLLVFTFGCWLALAPADAMQPAGIKLNYDLNKRILTVTIVHDRMGDTGHFIKFVEVKKNGTVASINTYTSQPDEKLLVYQYRINAIEEDTLQVIATCNKAGSKASSVLIVSP